MGVICLNYEDLLLEADSHGLIVKEKNIPGFNGRIHQNRIAINKDLSSSVKKSCILAEELGHYYTTYGNIVEQQTIEQQKQEFRAKVWAYQRLITMDKLIEAYYNGCRNLFELAEELDVTEEFLQEALDIFNQKYGPYIQYKNYLIRFNPVLDIYKFVP